MISCYISFLLIVLRYNLGMATSAVDFKDVKLTTVTRSSIDAFKFRCGALLALGVDESAFLNHIILHLPDDILVKVGHKLQKVVKIKELIEVLEETVVGQSLPLSHMQDFESLRQKSDESLSDMFQRLLTIGQKAFPDFDSHHLNQLISSRIPRAAHSAEGATFFLEALSQGTSLENALLEADKRLLLSKSVREVRANGVRDKRVQDQRFNHLDFQGRKDDGSHTERRKVELIANSKGTTDMTSERKISAERRSDRGGFNGYCYNCGDEGHMARQCRYPQTTCPACSGRHLPKFCPLN